VMRKRINKLLLTATIAMFILAGIRIAVDATTTFAMVRDLETGTISSLNPKAPFPWTSAITCTATNIVVLMADGFLIYRCWVVYARSMLKITFPSILWVGGFVCTILQLYWQVVQSAVITDVWIPVNMSVGPGTVLTPFWACTILVNLYSTGMIVYRIWKMTKRRPEESVDAPLDLRFIIRILAESGVLYLLVTIPHFIAWWTKNDMAITVLAWINVPITCSAFNLIIIRTARHRAEMEIEKDIDSHLSEMSFGRPTNVLNSSTLQGRSGFSSTQSAV